MSALIKICGITEKDGLRAAFAYGADFIGFIFCEKGISRRYIEPAAAASLLDEVAPHMPQPHPKRVGVLRDQTDEEILAITRAVKLDYLQLHGKETPARVTEIKKLTGLPCIKAFSLKSEDDFARVKSYEGATDMYLFDTPSTGPSAGGTGKSFDWSLLTGKTIEKPWFLAGGLTLQTMEEALKITSAPMLDISSGAQQDSGMAKDVKKIESLCARAKAWQGSHWPWARI